MKKQSTAIWASVLLVLTALVLGSLVQYAFYGRDGDQIVLPGGDTQDHTSDSEIAKLNKELLETLTVSKENVSVLLSQLSRPAVYHWESRVTLTGDTGSGQLQVSADEENGMLRVSVRRGQGAAEEYILTDLRFYAWESGDTLLYSGKREDFTADEIMMSLTWEELLQTPAEQLLDACVTQENNRDCIAVSALDPTSGYRLEYRISVEDGMLLSLTAFRETSQVYRVERLILEQGVVRSGAFYLPDGSLPETSNG